MTFLEISKRLRPHQHQPVEHLCRVLETYPGAVDESDCGIGKTYVAAAVAKILGLPALVVCPKISCTNWHTAAEHFEDTISAVGYEKLRTGRTPFGTWEHQPPPGMEDEKFFVCQSCQLPVNLDPALFQPCYTHPLGIHCIAEKRRKWKYGKFSFAPEIKLLIFDEAHRCNAVDSLNAKMLIAARRQGIKTLCLSATLAHSPLHFWALGWLLGLHTLTPAGGLGFYQWAARYGCRRDINLGPGVHWLLGEEKQKQVMRNIRASVIPSRGVRVAVKDIPGFPECDISAELYDIDEKDKISAEYETMRTAIAELDKIAENDIDSEHPLTKALRAHQRIELLKVPLAVELCGDYISKGYSVGLFCNYKQTIAELAARLGTSCIIDGGTTGKARDKAQDDFCQDRERAVIVNSKAGGISITLSDIRGQYPRVGVVFPCYDLVTMKQLTGRFPRDCAKSKSLYRVMFAAGTVEADIYKAWRAKDNNLNALNDGDMCPPGINLRKMYA